MKTNKFLKLIMSIFAFVSVSSCFAINFKNNIEAKAEQTKKTAVFDSIAWNNVVFDETNVFIPTGAFGECLSGNAPQDGYVVLAFFKYSDGSDSEGLSLGNLCDASSSDTMAASNLADDACSSAIRINGISINDVENAGLYIYPFHGLLFYLPHDSLDFTTFEVPTINLSTTINLGTIDIEPFSLGFMGSLGIQGGWQQVKDKSIMPTIEFSDVAGGWNNNGSSPTTRNTILGFGENTQSHIDYLKEDHKPDDTNLVAEKSDCGNLITINGIPLKNIEGFIVNYLHGNNYVYMNYPISALTPSNGYKVTTLHIEEGCQFHDVLLGEVNLYLYNNQWQKVSPTYPEDKEYEGAMNLTSLFGVSSLTLDSSNNHFGAELESTPGEFKVFIDYVLNSETDSFIAYLFGTSGQNGIRVVAKNNTINVYDSTNGNVNLGSATLETFTYGDWNALFIYGRIEDGGIQIKVAIDDINYVVVNSGRLENKNAIGQKIDFYLGEGSVTLRDAVLGCDIKKPIITYSGKAIYAVKPGTNKINFDLRCVAIDAVDGVISDKLIYTWEEGSLTDDIINIGEWTVTISVKDNANNETMMTVLVVCRAELDVYVTFDGKNPTKYTIGDSIAKPVDPKSDNPNEEFIGWYLNDIPWDFENDCIVQDMNLTSKFKLNVKEYAVNVIVSGMDMDGYVVYFASGTLVNVSVFEIEGYSLIAKINNKEVDSFRVDSNLILKIEYTKTENDKKGCKGSIGASVASITLASGLAVALLALKKKEEK